jgi:cell division initiation protein
MVGVVFLTPPEVQHQTLKGGRGYDREAVDELLERVTSSYEQVWLERDELRSRVTEIESELATFRETDRYLRETLVAAQRTADEIRSDAQTDAERLKREALADLERAKADAKRDLDDLRVEIEQFNALERQLRSNLRGFLEAAVSQIEEAGVVQEAPVGTFAEALAPETARVEHHDS